MKKEFSAILIISILSLIYYYITRRTHVNKYYDILHSNNPNDINRFLELNKDWKEYVLKQTEINEQKRIDNLRNEIKKLDKKYKTYSNVSAGLAAVAPILNVIPVVGTIASIACIAGSAGTKLYAEGSVKTEAIKVSQKN